jgi:hypothetical protein
MKNYFFLRPKKKKKKKNQNDLYFNKLEKILKFKI